MKIVFIANGHSSVKKGISGGEVHNFELINRFTSTKNEFFVCCPSNYKNIEGLKNVTVLKYPPVPYEDKVYNIFSLLFFIYCYRTIVSAVVLYRFRPDLIISGSHLFYDILPAYFVVNKQTKLVTYIHHVIGEQTRTGVSAFINRFLERISFRVIKAKSSIVFSYSTVGKNALVKKYGFNEKTICMFQNGIDLKMVNSVKADDEPHYDLCFCGRLNKTKGIYDLVNIVKLVKARYPNIVCAVVGEGPEEQGFKNAIRNNGLETNVRLLGIKTRPQVIKIMKSSKIFVLPSHEEGWGIVIGEAMASGVPAVVYDLKDIIEIWQDNLVWVKCFNTKNFANAVIKLLNDKNEREFFSQRGFNFIKSLDWDVVIKKEIDTILGNIH